MRKILLLVLVIGLLMLSGCKSESRHTLEDWALHYALEQYEEDYGGYGVFGNFIIRGKITSDNLEQLEENQYAVMYLIMIIDDTGRGRLYNVFIFYEDKVLWDNMIVSREIIKESQIIDVDIEEVLYYD